MTRYRFAAAAVATSLLAVPALALGTVTVPGSDTQLKLYGFVMVFGEYYANAGQPNNSFISPLDGSSRPEGQFQITAQTSRLGFSTVTPSLNLGDIETRVEQHNAIAPDEQKITIPNQKAQTKMYDEIAMGRPQRVPKQLKGYLQEQQQ